MLIIEMMLICTMNCADCPRTVSSDMKYEQQPLNLRGQWKGTWRHAQGFVMPASLSASEDGRIMGILDAGVIFIHVDSIIDEGEGTFRIKEGKGFVGIYKVRKESIALCFRPSVQGYPRVFRGGDGQHLLILRRIKTEKNNKP